MWVKEHESHFGSTNIESSGAWYFPAKIMWCKSLPGPSVRGVRFCNNGGITWISEENNKDVDFKNSKLTFVTSP